MYDNVTTAGLNMDQQSAPRRQSPLQRLYWQQMLGVLLEMNQNEPDRNVVRPFDAWLLAARPQLHLTQPQLLVLLLLC